MSDSDPYDLRAKYTHFRILVIGRANAGKTTLLQRVCNTTEDPCIYDDNKNLVSVHKPKDEFCFWQSQLAWTYLSGTSFTIDIYLLLYWPYISARDTRYQSAICIQEQSRFYLPRFSWIWDRRRDATAESPVIYGREGKVEGSTRSAPCYLVSFSISTYVAPDDRFCGEGFVLFWTKLGLYCHWKRPSLRQRELGKVSFYHPSFKFQSPI